MLNVFYRSINLGYRWIFGSGYMLHAPLFLTGDETLLKAQGVFVDHCMSFLPDAAGERILDVGCGNGMQTLHVLQQFRPSFIYGVDIVGHQVGIAMKNILPGMEHQVHFAQDDAQRLATVADQSFDVILCIESALHYPDKDKFLQEATRVLVPGGRILIADLTLRKNIRHSGVRRKLVLNNWTAEQYRTAFARHSFELIADEGLNALLIASFRHAYKNIAAQLRAKNSFSSFFLLMIVRPAINLYLRALKNVFEYRLFMAQI